MKQFFALHLGAIMVVLLVAALATPTWANKADGYTGVSDTSSPAETHVGSMANPTPAPETQATASEASPAPPAVAQVEIHQGPPGQSGQDGRNGRNGRPGRDGRPGRPGKTIIQKVGLGTKGHHALWNELHEAGVVSQSTIDGWLKEGNKQTLSSAKAYTDGAVSILKPSVNQPAQPALVPANAEERRPVMSGLWEIFLFIVAIAAVLGCTFAIVSGLRANQRENAELGANNRIAPRRVALGVNDPPAYAGPARGKGGALHFDGRGVLVGWEKWETPIPADQAAIQVIQQGSLAVVVTTPGQPTNVVDLREREPEKKKKRLAEPGRPAGRNVASAEPLDPNNVAGQILPAAT